MKWQDYLRVIAQSVDPGHNKALRVIRFEPEWKPAPQRPKVQTRSVHSYLSASHQ